MLGVAVITLFRCRRFYSERIATPFGRLILRIWGIRMIVHQPMPFPARQVVFISNHTSTIDVFALVAHDSRRAADHGLHREIEPLLEQ